MKSLSAVLSFLLVATTFVVLAAERSASQIVATGRLETMRLLAPETGWSAAAHQLFWTENAGKSWEDITPPTDDETIASVFFLDTSKGWALLSKDDEPQPRFRLASTTNAGKSWLITRIAINHLSERGITLGGKGSLNFVDSTYGWVNLSVVGSSAFHMGVLLATEDGGKTWDWALGGSGTGGLIRFIDREDGWVASPQREELYETHDGAKSWHELSLKAPQDAYPAVNPTYDLPVFEDDKHGFLPVTYSAPYDNPNGTSALVLFSTVDGGRIWKVSRTLPKLEETSIGTRVPAAIVDSSLLTATLSGVNLTLTTLATTGNGTNGVASSRSGSQVSVIDELSFVDRTRGWLLGEASKCTTAMVACAQLLSTNDGGSTWVNVTPGVSPRLRGSSVKPTEGVSVSPQDRATASAPGQFGTMQQLITGQGAPTHLAFDVSDVMLSGKMATWWDASPYWDTGVYLLNAPSRHNDPNMSSAWITAVEQQGWGFIPTWLGDQAPCGCMPVGPTPCTHWPHTIPSAPANNYVAAYNEGVAEAQAALLQATALSLPSGIIYTDIENYAPDGGACSLPVQRYLSGWVTQMHASVGAGSAGVYGNPLPAQDDFAAASPMPDDVWIAKYDNRITIWGLSPLGDTLWTNSQARHPLHVLDEA